MPRFPIICLALTTLTLTSVLSACGGSQSRVPIKSREGNQGAGPNNSSMNWSKLKTKVGNETCLDLEKLLKELHSKKSSEIQIHTEDLAVFHATSDNKNIKPLNDKKEWSAILRKEGLALSAGPAELMKSEWSLLNVGQEGCQSISFTQSNNDPSPIVSGQYDIAESDDLQLALVASEKNYGRVQRLDFSAVPSQDQIMVTLFYLDKAPCDSSDILIEKTLLVGWGQSLDQNPAISKDLLKRLDEEVSFGQRVKDLLQGVESGNDNSARGARSLVKIPYASYISALQRLEESSDNLCQTQEEPDKDATDPEFLIEPQSDEPDKKENDEEEEKATYSL